MSAYVKIVVKTPGLQVPLLVLKLPADWTVARVKETIAQHHPKNPPAERQDLFYKGTVLRGAQTLETLELVQDSVNVLLSIKPGHGPDQAHRFESSLLKARESEFLLRYQRLCSLPDAEDGFLPPVLTRLPLLHPDMTQRLKCFLVKPIRVIKLQSGGLALYLQWTVLLRGLLFISVLYYLTDTHDRVPNILILLILYLVHVRFALERHRNEQLAQVPRQMLVAKAPDLFKQPEKDQNNRNFGLCRQGYETFRSFLWSFLPWFEPEDYAEQRYRGLMGRE